MMSSMFSLFYLQVLEKLDSQVLEFWLWPELAISEGFWLDVSNMQ